MDDQLTFVVLEFPTGTRAWLPLPGSEAELAALLAECNLWVEVGRTGDPKELERLSLPGHPHRQPGGRAGVAGPGAGGTRCAAPR